MRLNPWAKKWTVQGNKPNAQWLAGFLNQCDAYKVHPTSPIYKHAQTTKVAGLYVQLAPQNEPVPLNIDLPKHWFWKTKWKGAQRDIRRGVGIEKYLRELDSKGIILPEIGSLAAVPERIRKYVQNIVATAEHRETFSQMLESNQKGIEQLSLSAKPEFISLSVPFEYIGPGDFRYKATLHYKEGKTTIQDITLVMSKQLELPVSVLREIPDLVSTFHNASLHSNTIKADCFSAIIEGKRYIATRTPGAISDAWSLSSHDPITFPDEGSLEALAGLEKIAEWVNQRNIHQPA